MRSTATATRYAMPPIAPSHAYGCPSCPRATSTTKATMIAVITTRPAIAVAARSIRWKRSSRPSPRRPRIVSLRPPKRTIAAKIVITARACNPSARLPPIQIAAIMTIPSPTENAGRNHFDLLICIEHLLHPDAEEPTEGDRERERGDVPAGLDRVDRLPGHVHRLRQL